MNIHELLKAFAEELENPDNVALRNAESADEKDLDIVASACIQAAAIFRKASEEVTQEEPSITPENLEEMAVLAAEFDASGDELLQKQASVLDQILLTIAAPKGVKEMSTRYENEKIEELKKEYAKTKESLDDNIKVSDARKDIEKSDSYKEYRPLEAALNTRYCPDHPGVMTSRVGEHEYQCALDKKTYNWETGYRTSKGNSVPGGRVEDQSQNTHIEPHALFDNRESRLASNQK